MKITTWLLAAAAALISCTGSTDPCGNGVLDPSEACDTDIASGAGACPSISDCNDNDDCTHDAIEGGGCFASCNNTPIDEPRCRASCGNGILEPTEQCDTAIPIGQIASCPTIAGCDDGDSCTTDQISGDGCAAVCTHTPIMLHVGGDRCCPAGANATTDADCASSCGNNIIEPGETCDGDCPAMCSDNIACTRDMLEGSGCNVVCRHAEITSIGPADGCCPAGGSPGNDADCAGCGDGVVRGSESCDTGITHGPGRCPTVADCNDGDACTIGQLVAQGTCNAQCLQTPITGNVDGDGCCLAPNQTPRSTDNDCPVLSLYWDCAENGDCASQQCKAFDFYSGAKICTADCDPNVYPLDGGCAPVPPFVSICMTQPIASGARDETCMAATLDNYSATDPDIGALLRTAVLSGTIQATDDLDLYFLGGELSATPINIRVTPQAGLDTYVILLGPTLAGTAICNSAAAGQADVCAETIPGNGARSFIAIAGAQGTGSYTLTAEATP